jgi:hypothetical protein
VQGAEATLHLTCIRRVQPVKDTAGTQLVNSDRSKF